MFWKIAKLIAEGYVVSLIPHRRNISRIQAAGNLTAVFAAVTRRAVCYITGANFTAKNPCALQHLSPATRGCPRRQYDHADVGQGRFIDQMVGPRAQILLMYRWTSLLPINDFSCHCQVSSNDIPWHGGRMCFFWQLPYAIKVVSPYKSNLRRPGPLGVSFSEIS